MSIRHMSAVWDDPYFESGDKVKLLVALSLADNARAEDGKAWPSIESIARKARTSIRGAQEACRELEKDGKIRIVMNGGQNGTNAYFLLFTPAHAAPARTAPPRKRAAEKAAEIPAEKAAADCTQNRQEPSVTDKNGKEPNPAHAEFVKLWCDEYPKFHNGDKYAFQGKDAAAVSSLLRSSQKTPSDLLRVAVAAWKSNGFWSKNASSLCLFNSRFNEIRGELNSANPQKGIRENIKVPIFEA